MKSFSRVIATLALLMGGLTLGPSRALAQVPKSSHVFIVFGENTSYSGSVGHMPYLDSLVSKYGLATNYVADTHPSIGNYLVWASGLIQTNDDGFRGTFNDDNIALDVQSAGLTWKDYVEDINSSCPGLNSGGYAEKHDPLAYFSNINQANRVCFSQFATDLKNNTLPNLSYLGPNLCDDAHDCSLGTFDGWLKTEIAPLLASSHFQAGGDGLLVITFDEGSGSTSNSTSGIESGTWTGGKVETVVISPHAKAGYQSTNSYHHESVLRLMEEALGLTEFPGASSNPNSALTAPINMSDFFNTTSGSVTLSPSSLTFPSTNDGSTSSALTVTLSNTTSSAVSPGIAISGTNASDFSQTNTCGTSLAGNTSCTVSVTFKPISPASGTLSATLTSTATTETVTLTGTAVNGSTVATATVSPTSLTFHNTGSAKAVTLTNTSTTANLTGISISVSSTDFTASPSTCPNLTPGASCTISVSFTPPAGGTYGAMLNVSDSAGTQQVTLSGHKGGK